LPDSMEGPTPISALIHAATMVTADIFMVARMSPLFELSDTALNLVLTVGAITALFMGFLGIVQNDIKRVVAYSTLSQLGYMTVALGASAYSVAVFHLMTHAFFKALLFLGAGSVIMGMHHNQDIRYMGGLRKYMPITWMTSLVGSLALIGTPLFSGFYSKDSIIEAVAASQLPAASWAHFAVLMGVFVTAFYSFRMYFLVFHGQPRFNQDPHAHHGDSHGHTPHESPWVVTLPLVLLAIPSALIGFYTIAPMLFGDFFKDAIYVNTAIHPAMHELQDAFRSPLAMAEHALTTWPFFLALAGVLVAFYMYMVHPSVPVFIQQHVKPLYKLLVSKYFLDDFNEKILARGARWLAIGLWKGGDQRVIDGYVVNGSWRVIGKVALVVRRLQTGFLYHYALLMILGMFGLITWFVWLKP
ncbi:MAG: NADH-quinone oxidoreductase subunit L, partial [Limnohabitans sp.]